MKQVLDLPAGGSTKIVVMKSNGDFEKLLGEAESDLNRADRNLVQLARSIGFDSREIDNLTRLYAPTERKDDDERYG